MPTALASRKSWPPLAQLALDFFLGPDPEPPTRTSQAPSVPAADPQGFIHATANRHALLQGVTVS